jgi:hypothetical protein
MARMSVNCGFNCGFFLAGCTSYPVNCQNGGTPTESGNACVCRCPEGTRGEYCEMGKYYIVLACYLMPSTISNFFSLLTGCSGLLDLALVIDASGSIRNERFSPIIEFLVEVVEQFHLEGDGGQTRIAGIHFSDKYGYRE